MTVSLCMSKGAALQEGPETGQGALNANARVDFDVWGLGTPLGEAQLKIWPLKIHVALRTTFISSGQILSWASPMGVPRPQT